MTSQPEQPSLPTRRILIVDDDESCQELFRKVLLEEEEGFRLESARSAEEAQEILTRLEFCVDLCLVDMVLPGMHGSDLLEWIKRVSPKMPVVMLSGYHEDDKILHCLRNGAIDFIAKPVPVRKLAQVLRYAVDRQAQINEAPGEIQALLPSGGWVELTAPSEMEYLARMQRFTDVLLSSRFSEEVGEDLRLAIEEAGRNAIEWGNRFDRNKQVRISYCLFSDRIVFKFEDEGEGFNPQVLPDPSRDPRSHIAKRKEEGKRPGGFGVFLVRKLMDDVAYSERGNVVLMTKYLNTVARATDDKKE